MLPLKCFKIIGIQVIRIQVALYFFVVELKIASHKFADFVKSLSKVVKLKVFGMDSKELNFHDIESHLFILKEEIVNS